MPAGVARDPARAPLQCPPVPCGLRATGLGKMGGVLQLVRRRGTVAKAFGAPAPSPWRRALPGTGTAGMQHATLSKSVAALEMSGASQRSAGEGLELNPREPGVAIAILYNALLVVNTLISNIRLFHSLK